MDLLMKALEKKDAKAVETFGVIVQLIGVGKEYIERALNGTLDQKPESAKTAPKGVAGKPGEGEKPTESPEAKAAREAKEAVEAKRKGGSETTPAAAEKSAPAPVKGPSDAPNPEKPAETPKKGMTYGQIEKQNKERIATIDGEIKKSGETVKNIEQ